jgi:hypothetical protein
MFNFFNTENKYDKYKVHEKDSEEDSEEDPEEEHEEEPEIKDNNVILFVKYLFTFLKKNKMCFLSGTIIFQDNNNELFNFLTFNNKNKNNDLCYGKVESSNGHFTKTHLNVYNKKEVISAETCVNDFLTSYNKFLESKCGKKKHECFKMEYVFNNKIDYLCDQETMLKSINPKNISTKGVILYYRFKIQNKTYLFFKLEGHRMNSLKHVGAFLNKNRKDIYPKRRENVLNYNYNKDFLHIDKKFYDIQLKDLNNKNQIIEEINYYNNNLRTGHELFIYEDLKNKLLNYKELNIEDTKLEDTKLEDIILDLRKKLLDYKALNIEDTEEIILYLRKKLLDYKELKIEDIELIFS